MSDRHPREERLAALLSGAGLSSTPPEDLEERTFEALRLEEVGRFIAEAPLEAEPPADLEARSLARAFSARQAATVVRTDRWGRATKILAPALAAAAVVLGLFAFNLSQRLEASENQPDPLPTGHEMQVIALSGSIGEAELGLEHFRHDNYRLSLYASDLAIHPQGFHYEMWLTGGSGVVSAGSFRIERSDEIIFDFLVGADPKDFPNLEVTLEPEDGDPAKTGEVVMRGVIDPSHVDHGGG